LAQGSLAMGKKEFEALKQACAGALAAVVANCGTMPISVILTRIQVTQKPALTIARDIAAKDGLLGFYRGLNSKNIEASTKNFVFFYLYDWILSIAKQRGIRISTVWNLTLGYIAGCFCAIFTLPLEVISTKIQAQSSGGMLSVVRETLATSGFRGLFSGLWFNILLSINPSIQNTCFDKTKAAVLAQKSKGNAAVQVALSPGEAFFLGAIAKALATLVTYPLVRLKTKLQVANGEDKEERASVFQRFARLYSGLGASLLKTVLTAAMMYAAKDELARLTESVLRTTLQRGRGHRYKLRAIGGRSLAS